MNIRQKVGIELRELRKAMKISQQEVAIRAGLKRRTVTSVENGEFDSKLETLSRIADVLNADVLILKRV